ncbi:MAG: aspartate/glutamate racemase family protein [Rhodobacteraceae bacterium]|nr:aspartate/glutamate racemase family protein [Paracoccaceae bacterium]
MESKWIKAMYRVLYLSPVAPRPRHEELFADMVRAHKWPETEARVACLPAHVGQFNHVEFRSYEALVTPDLIRGVRAASREGFDACVIGCFYDTAVLEAREISGEMIVTAPCEASCDIAATLSNRFGIIVGRQKWVNQMQKTVHRLGHGDRLTGFYAVGLGVTDFQTDHGLTRRCLMETADRAVNRDHAEALILGCTMEIGFHKDLERMFGVPVIDPSSAAFMRAQYFARLKQRSGLKPSRKWSCEAPPEDEMQTLDVFEQPPFFGNEINIPAQGNRQ